LTSGEKAEVGLRPPDLPDGAPSRREKAVSVARPDSVQGVVWTTTASNFLKTKYLFSLVAAGTEREALLRLAEKLCSELGYAQPQGDTAGAQELASAEREAMVGMLSAEDEKLVKEMRLGLARLAAAVGAGAPPTGAPKSAVRVALDGVELVMRGELIRGNGTQLGALMPSFVFLVTLPMVEQDEALELSQRTSDLVEKSYADE
jgi:hypothetical protein